MVVTEYRKLNVALWVAQVILAVAFAITGFIKVALPFEWVGDILFWAKDQPEALIRFIGVCELFAAFGLIVPGVARRLPSLVPITAFALMGQMFLAIGFHLMKHQTNQLLAPFALFLLSAFVAWGRTGFAPIPPSHPLHAQKPAAAPR